MMKDIVKSMKVRNFLKQKFPNERLLMKGLHTTNSSNASIFHFTVHRCASQFILKIFKIIEKHSDMTQIQLEAYLWNGGQIVKESKDIYKKFGYLYGPYYGMDKEELTLPISNLDDFKIFLMLRDPRDVLTSYYWYQAYSSYESPAKQEFLMARNKEVQAQSIDTWVLEKAPVFKARYEEYSEKFHGKPNVLFLKYEDMVADFEPWLSRLIEFTGLNLGEKTIELIKSTANFNVDKEDRKSHKRQVTPGDYKRKLKEETIQVLNAEFEKILERFQY